MKILIVGGKKVLEDQLLQGKNIHIKFNTCGRQNCACKLGYRHGPYYYRRKKIQGKYKDIYVKPPDTKLLPFEYKIVESDILADIKNVDDIPSSFSNCSIFKISSTIK